MPSTRVNKIANVVVPVAEQDQAVDFYVNKLGFEKRVDIPFGDSYRWIEVGLGEQETTIALAPPPEGQPVGNRETGISLLVEDVDAYHAELRQSGVDVDPEVVRLGEPVPPMFWLRDPEGNRILVVQ